MLVAFRGENSSAENCPAAHSLSSSHVMRCYRLLFHFLCSYPPPLAVSVWFIVHHPPFCPLSPCPLCLHNLSLPQRLPLLTHLLRWSPSDCSSAPGGSVRGCWSHLARLHGPWWASDGRGSPAHHLVERQSDVCPSVLRSVDEHQGEGLHPPPCRGTLNKTSASCEETQKQWMQTVNQSGCNYAQRCFDLNANQHANMLTMIMLKCLYIVGVIFAMFAISVKEVFHHWKDGPLIKNWVVCTLGRLKYILNWHNMTREKGLWYPLLVKS